MIKIEGGCRAAAPKGSMTYAFTHMRNFLLLAIVIWAFGLRFETQARIWALRLGSESEGGAEEKKEEEEEEEKIPHMCESIGHRPLRGRCPAPPSTSTTTYLSRARVPLTI